MSLDEVEEKWYRKTIAAFKQKWASGVRASTSFDSFCEGISAATGIPSATIRASLPAKNWQAFQQNADRYLSRAVQKIEAAHRAGKWAANYRRAFGA